MKRVKYSSALVSCKFSLSEATFKEFQISDIQSISITADIFPGEPLSVLMLHSQLSIGISDLINWKGQHNYRFVVSVPETVFWRHRTPLIFSVCSNSSKVYNVLNYSLACFPGELAKWQYPFYVCFYHTITLSAIFPHYNHSLSTAKESG